MEWPHYMYQPSMSEDSPDFEIWMVVDAIQVWDYWSEQVRSENGGLNPYGDDSLSDGVINFVGFAKDVWQVVRDTDGPGVHDPETEAELIRLRTDIINQYYAIHMSEAQGKRQYIEYQKSLEESKKLAEERRNRLRIKKGSYARANQGGAGARNGGRRGITSNMLTGPAGSQARAAKVPTVLGGNSFLGH